MENAELLAALHAERDHLRTLAEKVIGRVRRSLDVIERGSNTSPVSNLVCSASEFEISLGRINALQQILRENT